jgi:hypothetical protein
MHADFTGFTIPFPGKTFFDIPFMELEKVVRWASRQLRA